MPFFKNGRVLSIFICLGETSEIPEGAGTEMEGSAAVGTGWGAVVDGIHSTE